MDTSEIQSRISRYASSALSSHRQARGYRNCSKYLQGFLEGQAATYFLIARSLKGWETEARTVNRRKVAHV